jgi:hypothetical protein
MAPIKIQFIRLFNHVTSHSQNKIKSFTYISKWVTTAATMFLPVFRMRLMNFGRTILRYRKSFVASFSLSTNMPRNNQRPTSPQITSTQY